MQNDCMTKATEFDTEQKERGEELEALASAKSILEEKTGGAGDRAYSFLQVKVSTKARALASGEKELRGHQRSSSAQQLSAERRGWLQMAGRA